MNNEDEINLEDVVKKHQLPNTAPQIAWGADFDDRSDGEKVAFLKKFANSFNHALDLMQTERNVLKDRCDHLEKQIANDRSAIDTQREMIQRATRDLNETKQVYQDKINKLEAKLRDLM